MVTSKVRDDSIPLSGLRSAIEEKRVIVSAEKLNTRKLKVSFSLIEPKGAPVCLLGLKSVTGCNPAARYLEPSANLTNSIEPLKNSPLLANHY